MRYEEYKDSGVAWIGEIPSHWEVAAFKRRISINNGRDYKEFQDDEIYPVMGSGGCFAYCSRYMYDGEALLLGRKGTIDKPLYINGKFWTVDTMFYAIPNKDLDCKFAYYLAITFPFNLYSTSTALPSMTQTDLGNNPVAFPPLVEQQAIASYLDKKGGKINGAIDVQKKKIDLLNELKQTIITNAVTKGLNPNAPMKDSGVEWIGQVPEHWEVCKLKYILKLINGRAYSQNELLDDGKYKVLRVGNFFTNEQWYYSNLELEKEKYCHSGDLLFAWSASFGPKIWNEDNTIFHYHIWKVNIAKTYDKMYAYYILTALSDFKRGDVHGSTMVHLTMDNMNNSFLTIPSLSEQQSIVKYIEFEVSKVDAQISRANRRIELLNELKQSIITEAVTGKIKVI